MSPTTDANGPKVGKRFGLLLALTAPVMAVVVVLWVNSQAAQGQDPTPRVTISTETLSVEKSKEKAYTVSLATAPTADVLVSAVYTETASIVSVSPATLTFTSTNYSMAQSFAVMGVNTGTHTVSHTASSTDTNYEGITIDKVTVTVTEPANKTIEVSSTASVTEAAGATADLTVTLGENAPTGGLVVDVSYGFSGTAETADTGTRPSAVTVAAGSMTATVSVPINNDALVEDNETFTVTVAPSTAATTAGWAVTSGKSQATITITDDDRSNAAIAFGSSATGTSKYTVSVAENVAAGHVDVPITISHSPESNTTFAVYFVSNPTESRPATRSTDFTVPTAATVVSNPIANITFSPSTNDADRTKNVRIGLVDDNLVEFSETIEITIGDADSTPDDLGDHYDRNAMSRLATVTVTDEDSDEAKIAFGTSAAGTAAHDITRNENVGANTANAGKVTVPITMNHLPQDPTTITVELLTTGTNLATETDDFSIDTTTLSFDASSAKTQNITLTLVNDELVEHDQVIPLGIVAADATPDDLGDLYGRDAAGATANITIADDEQAKAKISFGNPIATSRHTGEVAELTGTIDVPVTISHLPDATTTIAVEVTGGTARETDDPDNTTGNPKDFEITTKSVQFTSSGDKTQNLTVGIENDSVEEDDETIELRIAVAANPKSDIGDYYQRQGTGATARLTVTSADAVTSITLSGTAMPDSAHDNRIYVAENTKMTITATSNIPVGPRGWRVSVSAAGTGDNPATDNDFTLKPTSITIPEGQTTATTAIDFTAKVLRLDFINEPDEDLNVTGSATKLGNQVGSSPTSLASLLPAGGLPFRITDSDSSFVSSERGSGLDILKTGTAEFTVNIRPQSTAPTANVIVSVASSATQVATVSPATFTITTTGTSWQTPQTITVTGVAAGDAKITFSSTSTDQKYNGLTSTDEVRAAGQGKASPLPIISVTVTEPSNTFTLSTNNRGTEGDSVPITVSLGNFAPTDGLPFTVSASTTCASCTASASDVGTVPGSFTIAAGARSGSFSIPLADDELVEFDQTFQVTVATAATMWAASKSTSVTINDDDRGEDIQIWFGPADATDRSEYNLAVQEDAGTVNIPVSVSHLPDTETEFPITIFRASGAVEGEDFSVATKSVTFRPTDTGNTQNLAVEIIDDAVVEPNKNVVFELQPVSDFDSLRRRYTAAVDVNDGVATAAYATVTIDSEDVPTGVSLTANGATSVTVSEGETITVAATIDNNSLADAGGVVVSLSHASITDTSCTIPEFERSCATTVSFIDDQLAGEDPQTFTLAVSTSPTLTVTANPTITLNDVNSADLVLSRSSATVCCTGLLVSYSLRITSRPTSPVEVTIAPEDRGLARVTSNSVVTFTASNWTTNVRVSVEGLNAGTTRFTHEVTSSTDPNYALGTIYDPFTFSARITTRRAPVTGGGVGGGGGGGGGGGDDPPNEPPLFASATTSRSVQENSVGGTAVGSPVTATDPDDDTLRYSLSGADASLFRINSGTGQLTVAPGTDLDFEGDKRSYTVTVTARDPGGSDETAEIAVTINVTDAELPGLAGDYDADNDESLDLSETLTAVQDYLAGDLTVEEIIALIRQYLQGS